MEEVLRGLECSRDVYEIIEGQQMGKYESDSHFGGVDNVPENVKGGGGKS